MKNHQELVGWVLASVLVCFGVFFGALLAGLTPVLGLDLQGGAQVVYAPAHQVPTDTLNEAISIIRQRVDALGVSDPNISQQGDNIVVQLPGVKHPQASLALIGSTAELRFRPVLCYSGPYLPPGGKRTVATQPPPPCGAQYQITAASSSSAQPDPALLPVPGTPGCASVVSGAYCDSASGTVLLRYQNAQGARAQLGPTGATGSIIKTASAQLNQQGQWQVNFTTTGAGSKAWDQVAQASFHQPLAIVLDGLVISAPVIQPDNATFQSFAGSGQITGNFTQDQAQNLALVLRYGSLPVQLNQQAVQTVSPTLGSSSLKAGLAAGLIGLILVLAYMVFYYRGLGLVVLAGLITTAAMLWGLIAILGQSAGLTLDLAGATGIIVSIGVTVDSYVVFFERLKDEVRAGRTIRTSVDRGFKRAFRTILAADAVSFIGAAVLYLLSVGQVRGFAFWLGVSTLLDVFTAYFFTRPLVVLLGQNPTFTEARWIGVAPGLAVSNETAEARKAPAPVGSSA